MLKILISFAVIAGLALGVDPADESEVPIRPGVPGKTPFWNENAKQFIWPPAFDFKALDGAKSYRFVASSVSGKSLRFDAGEPWASLAPIWKELPVGSTKLTVEALNAKGEVIGIAGTRQFHRAAPFNGLYAKPILPYRESARVALASLMHEPFVRSWKTTGAPDPEYPLYRYAAKVIGSLLSGCAMYATEEPRPADADDAIAIATRAADFLLGISAAPGSPLEYFPPTYHGAKPTERENDDWTMLMSPAEAGQGYLDLYDATRNAKYLDAAKRIATTYQKLQTPAGTWPLKVNNRTGESLAPIDLIPSVVISFLDRLAHHYDSPQFKPALDRAVGWMLENPCRTCNWQAQFDDAKLRGAYQNLAKHEACEFAAFLFRRAERIELAEEILRFAEDQFVVWESPPDLPARFENLKKENWFTPCSVEQYAMFEPISGSSAFMIVAYIRAYQATHNPIYLAKAQSLANALTLVQQRHHGRYPTRMVKQDLLYWLNSAVNTARAMDMLGQIEP